MGSLYCALVLVGVAARTRERLDDELADRAESFGGFWDAWFMDDGQIICEPALVDPLLRVLDDELAKVGATRGCRAPSPESAPGQDPPEHQPRECRPPGGHGRGYR